MRHRNTQSHSADTSLIYACREPAKPVPSPPHHCPTGTWGTRPSTIGGSVPGHMEVLCSPSCRHQHPDLGVPPLSWVRRQSWHLQSHRPDHCCLWPTRAMCSLALPLLCLDRSSSSALSSCQRSLTDLRAVFKPSSPWRASPLLPTSAS